MANQKRQPSEAEELYRQAVEYGQRGDVYNAVKLCKLVARLSPDWSAPFAYLGGVYRGRQEWKPTLHYCRKAVEHNPLNDTVWENMALAATALGQWKTARQAWNQLGFQFKESAEELHLDLGVVPVRLNPGTQPEIVEAHRIDPGRAILGSIPQPSSGRRFRDVVLLENKPRHSFVLQGRKLGVFDEIQVLKRSRWRTYAVVLNTSSQEDVDTLARLCTESDLGFDNWSNASRFFRPGLHPRVAEYFDQSVFGQLEREVFLVALASLRKKDVLAVLRNWRVITLKTYQGLECLA